MRTIPTALLEHLQSRQLTTAICWLIEKRDGTFIRGTEHDRDIVVTTTGDLAGTYKAGANITASSVQSGSELSPDNLEVNGAVAPRYDFIDVSVYDIEAGLLHLAPVTVFAVNWAAPDDGQLVLRRGFLGEIQRDSDGRYTTEIRGLFTLMSQQIIETYGERCVVKRFGDARCKLNLAPYTHTGAVTAVVSRREFTTDLSMSPFPEFRGGEFTFTYGPNETLMREVKSAGDDGVFTFWEPWPEMPEVGDQFSAIQGCDRSRAQCIGYSNIVNFRGFGLFVPGVDAIARGPT